MKLLDIATAHMSQRSVEPGPALCAERGILRNRDAIYPNAARRQSPGEQVLDIGHTVGNNFLHDILLFVVQSK